MAAAHCNSHQKRVTSEYWWQRSPECIGGIHPNGWTQESRTEGELEVLVDTESCMAA